MGSSRTTNRSGFASGQLMPGSIELPHQIVESAVVELVAGVVVAQAAIVARVAGVVAARAAAVGGVAAVEEVE